MLICGENTLLPEGKEYHSRSGSSYTGIIYQLKINSNSAILKIRGKEYGS